MARLNKERVKDWLDHPKRILVGGLVIGIGGFLLYKLGKKFLNRNKEKEAQKQADDSPAVRQAMAFRSACNPSGISWMRSFDMTNDEAVFSTAKQVTNLDDVIKAYRNLYSSDLLSDLQSDLDTDEYQKFLTLVSSNPNKQGGSAPVSFAKKNQMVVAKKEMFVRTSPNASYHEAWYEKSSGNNIAYQAKPGEFLGYATGQQHFDEENNVKFIQVAYLIKKEDLPESLKKHAGKKFSFWISASADYVDIFPVYKNMFDRYPNTNVAVRYKKPPDYYGSTVQGLPQKLVVSVKQTDVLNNRYQPYCKVGKNVLLGLFLGTVDTELGKLVKFRTVDNTERWAFLETIKIIEH
ncbi:MAG: hypothetical protein V2A54_13295 [Bacteroidota bacterium]